MVRESHCQDKAEITSPSAVPCIRNTHFLRLWPCTPLGGDKETIVMMMTMIMIMSMVMVIMIMKPEDLNKFTYI